MIVVLGPIRTSGQVLNVITFLTKTKLSRHFEENKKCNYYYNSSARASGILVHFSARSSCANIKYQAVPRGENF